uniref:Uncharacterized protein n=1 Tax=Romanomermis culicivorax TaxID=13658 RepID=A0A915KXC5_ROMCU
MKWANRFHLYRSTQVYFIVLSRSRTNGFNSKYFDSFHVRGELFLNPKSEAYDKLESTIGERIVSCACLWSEDCGTSNSSMAVPCHFEGDYKEEQCTATIYRTVTFRGENVRLPTTDLEGCHPVM